MQLKIAFVYLSVINVSALFFSIDISYEDIEYVYQLQDEYDSIYDEDLRERIREKYKEEQTKEEQDKDKEQEIEI